MRAGRWRSCSRRALFIVIHNAAAIRERGGQLTQEPKDQPWGARDFTVVDPDGFNISISTGVQS